MTYYVDFDGVILDTIPIYKKLEKENKKGFYDFNKILTNDLEINNSINILKIVSEKDNVIIITKVLNESEISAKRDFLKKNNINLKVIFLPNEEKKCDYVNISNNSILIDDSIDNVNDWINAGGCAYLFSKDNIVGYKCINDLRILLDK